MKAYEKQRGIVLQYGLSLLSGEDHIQEIEPLGQNIWDSFWLRGWRNEAEEGGVGMEALVVIHEGWGSA